MNDAAALPRAVAAGGRLPRREPRAGDDAEARRARLRRRASAPSVISAQQGEAGRVGKVALIEIRRLPEILLEGDIDRQAEKLGIVSPFSLGSTSARGGQGGFTSEVRAAAERAKSLSHVVAARADDHSAGRRGEHGACPTLKKVHALYVGTSTRVCMIIKRYIIYGHERRL